MNAEKLSTVQWRTLWEEHLSAEDRTAIRRAVRRGEPVTDAEHAALAVEYAERARRGVVVGAVAAVLCYGALLIIVLTILRPPMTWSVWMLVLTWGFVAVASSTMAVVRGRRFKRSRDATVERWPSTL